MIRLVLPLFVLLSCATVVQARLDETPAECEARYGVVIEKRPALQKLSDPEMLVFTKNGVTIDVEFHEGKAWRITYQKRGMDAEEIESVLMGEASGSGWSKPVKVAGQVFRTSADHSRVALIVPNLHPDSPVALVLATRDFANANRALFDDKQAELVSQGVLQQRLSGKGTDF